MRELIKILQEGAYSCVIQKEEIRTFSNRGVYDLYHLLKQEPTFLEGASAADKVIGQAAAALWVTGGIKRVYADVISEPALSLLRDANVEVEFAEVVPFIQNKDKSGWCPLESACRGKQLSEILPIVDLFICNMRKEAVSNGTTGK